MVLLSVQSACRKKRDFKRKIYIGRRTNCSRIKEVLQKLSDPHMKLSKGTVSLLMKCGILLNGMSVI